MKHIKKFNESFSHRSTSTDQIHSLFGALYWFMIYLFDIYLIPTNWGQCGWIHQDNEERVWLDSLVQKNVQYTQLCNGQPQYDISLEPYCMVINHEDLSKKPIYFETRSCVVGIELLSNNGYLASPDWIFATRRSKTIKNILKKM